MMRPCRNLKCHHEVDAWTGKRYCNSTCKQQAYRDRKKEKIIKAIENPIVHSGYCAWCHEEHFWTSHVAKRYCCNAHKQAAYRAVAKNHFPMMKFEEFE